jgi:hypothetical protein
LATIGDTVEGSAHPEDRALSDEGDGGLRRGDVRAPEYRYGVVFVLMLVVVVFLIVAPTANWSRAAALALQGAALLVAVATSRPRRGVRRARTALGALGAAAVVAAIATGVVPLVVVLALSGLVAAAIPPALAGGLLRLVRQRGVTLQAVAGSLAIYLLVGLLFSWLIALVASIDGAPYFIEGTGASHGQRVYFSFTVLTTTGFGDLTAATPVGRALAVVEMLVGQIYLVTVIGVLVGNFAGRRR